MYELGIFPTVNTFIGALPTTFLSFSCEHLNYVHRWDVYCQVPPGVRKLLVRGTERNYSERSWTHISNVYFSPGFNVM